MTDHSVCLLCGVNRVGTNRAVSNGEVRISVERNAVIGDPLYFLDWDGREFKTVIVEVRGHPPPPPVF